MRVKLVVNDPTLHRPTEKQISATELSVLRSSAAARSSLRVSRYACGDSPNVRRNSRLKCAREPGRTRHVLHPEWLGVARVGEILCTQQVAGGLGERHDSIMHGRILIAVLGPACPVRRDTLTGMRIRGLLGGAAKDPPVAIDDPRFEGWETVSTFEEQSTAVAWRDQLRALGVGAACVADHPLDRFGRGDIYLVVAPADWSRANEFLENLD